ncbi:hypothetical protein ACJDU8_17110 [Clostridium sp. WILCCON 0269]|uniref:Uncharacterized protein n=1 Tax=Candidatus Clostridium eludens TaxID=3381663 RepID=A0ABW8SNF9_9CLOT
MKLIKVEDGRLEIGNFYITSDMADYVGSATLTRDTTNNTISLVSDDYIERKFEQQNFVIEIEKQNWAYYSPNDYMEVYIGGDSEICGIRDDISGQSNCWKIVVEDGYIQVYYSNDCKNWFNAGGDKLIDSITRQGFKKKSDSSYPFTLQDYRIYKNSYITIQNLPENTVAILQDSEGNELKRRTFDENLQTQIILDYCVPNGKLIFLDPQGNTIYSIDNLDINYGDVFVLSPYDLEILYKGIVVVNPTLLDSFCEKVSIKNISTADTYNNLSISTTDDSDDLVQLSLDGQNFINTLAITSIAPNQTIDVYVKIIKSVNDSSYTVREFQLSIG